MMRYLMLLGQIGVALAFASTSRAAELHPAFASWLATQTQVRTWSADFVQIRALKSLTQPLTTTGHVWFAAPGQFRWELGKPAQTIAVRNASELAILYPRLKRVERFPLAPGQSGEWRDAMGLLEAGFPRSQAEIEGQYHIVSQTITGQQCEVALEPKAPTARRMIPQIRITFDTANQALLWTQLSFADGSTMRNEFSNRVRNAELPARIFELEIPSDYKVVEPLKR